MSGYTFETHTHYSQVTFTPELMEMEWADIDSATAKVSELVASAGKWSVLIDLSGLSDVPSSVIASLVKMWKSLDERRRNFVVVASSPEVTNKINQSGLTELWKLVPNLDKAYQIIGVTGTTDIEIPLIQSADAKRVVTLSDEPFEFTQRHAYCSVVLNPKLMELEWGHMESATTSVIELLKQSDRKSVMVDLSHMELINSGLVAALVRIWKAVKEDKGQFSLVSPNEMVSGVLQSAGLLKLWQVVDTREEAVYDLGVSTAAKSEARQQIVLTSTSITCATIAACATILMLMNRKDVWGVNAQLAALLLGSAGFTTGLLSVMKNTGPRRIVSSVAIGLGLLVLSTLWFKENPIAFGHQFPERNFDREAEDDEPLSTPAPKPIEDSASENETENTPERVETASGQETK